MPVCEAIFAGDPTEAHIVQAGNPTHLSGPLYAACTKARRFWRVIEITADPDDPKRTSRVSIEHARQQIATYGRDNPWVKVRVFGEFPPSSLNALIGPDEVSAAMKRCYRPSEIDWAAKVIGVDVARYGDDESALAFRQGLQAHPFKTYRNLNSTQGAGLVARAWEEFGAHACFVDDTGGFGSGWIDGLRRLGWSPIGVGFAAKPRDGRYFNKRAEMAFECVQWIKRGGALPESANLLTALTQTTYTFQGDKLLLEPKADLKARIGFSPDEFDALILTFAHPVTVPDTSTALQTNCGGVRSIPRTGRGSRLTDPTLAILTIACSSDRCSVVQTRIGFRRCRLRGLLERLPHQAPYRRYRGLSQAPSQSRPHSCRS